MDGGISRTDASGVTRHYCVHCDPLKEAGTPGMGTSSLEGESESQYGRFALIIGSILIVSLLLTFVLTGSVTLLSWMPRFMGVFFLTFAAFKFIDLSGFAASFSNYDIIAKRLPGYGRVYPYLEATLGLGYLTQPGAPLDVATLVLMSVSAIGVALQLGSKRKLRCACLGTFVKLPLTTVSLTEDVVMGTMSVVMLVAHLH